jgi:hypothetical protein
LLVDVQSSVRKRLEPLLHSRDCDETISPLSAEPVRVAWDFEHEFLISYTFNRRRTPV